MGEVAPTEEEHDTRSVPVVVQVVSGEVLKLVGIVMSHAPP